MRIITGAKPFIDIDAYGGILAYAELLEKQGIDCRAVSTSILNSSITPTVRSWQAPLLTDYKPGPDDTFTLIDVTNFESLDQIVAADRVDEIIDHHPGFENFWRQKIGDKARIELVGAACTLVYEHWQKAGRLSEMSQTSARALICDILDNTLNFGAKITSSRDKDAHSALLKIANLPEDWTSQYFAECQNAILEDIPKAVKDDYKPLPTPGWEEPLPAGQLSIWDAKTLIDQHLPEIKKTMSKTGRNWFMNIISVSEGRSYFVSEDPAMRKWLAEMLGITFEGNFATANRMWLRKEIVKEALNREG